MNPSIRRSAALIGLFLAVFLAARYLLPLFLPFVLGACLALAAEPLVRFLTGKLRLPRAAASGIGVSMSFSFLALAVMLLCGLLIRELRQLSGILPDLENAARSGMASLSQWLLALAQKAPDGLRTLLTRNVSDFFSGGSALLDKITGYLLSLASGILGKLPDSALSIGTGIISSFMISAKLPKLKQTLAGRIPRARLDSLKALLSRLKGTLGRWFRAQLKLSGVNFLVITAGFLLLRISYAPLWAFLVALVDAFPVLGTGTVLIPWSLISFLQGERPRAFGLLGVYAAAALTRSVLEPRLVGHQLGLDPLATLIALYAGYQLWGLPGMLLAPMLAAAAAQLTAEPRGQE
ncbi:MAG: sporulation integral membrane protein YtvI [Oscillospiraceae bacterium]|nr:sporulation integral membrane protein YtvI [Oscillospiraceae bacterium]